MYGCHLALVSGSIVLFYEASGAACLPRGVWPCGLSAAAPPVLCSQALLVLRLLSLVFRRNRRPAAIRRPTASGSDADRLL